MTLTEYLTDHYNGTIREFAKDSGVSFSTLKRIQQTGVARSTAVVEKIYAATGGKVTASDLIATASKAKRTAH